MPASLMIRCTVLGAVLVALAPGRATAQGDAQRATGVARLLARRIPEQLQRHAVPGAVAGVVYGTRVLLEEGFGAANRDSGLPADPNNSRFRIASVSKVFTALATVDASESGAVDLLADQRTNIDILKGAAAWQPITLHDLLTHTAGLDEGLIGYLAPTSTVTTLADALVRLEPAQTRPVGVAPAYSNYSYGLVGYLVEKAVGQSFRRYIRSTLFEPLGMVRTSFVVADSARTGAALATEYRSDGSVPDRTYSPTYPAGNVATTASDMNRFMRAFLAALRGDRSGPISPHAAQAMVSAQFVYHPEMPPMGYGLNGIMLGRFQAWIKGGASRYHSSVLIIVPELDLGIFIALNRQEPLLWDELLPEIAATIDAPVALPQRDSATPYPGIFGDYRLNRVALATPERLLGLAAQVRVAPDGNGANVTGLGLLAGSYRADTPTRLSRGTRGPQLAFRVEGDRASHVFSLVQGEPVTLERVPWWQTTRWQLGALLGASALIVIAAGLTWGGKRDSTTPRVAARWSMRSMPLALAGVVVAAWGVGTHVDPLVLGDRSSLDLALIVTTLTAVLALSQVAGGFVLATQPGVGPVRRGVYSLAAVSGLALFLIFWQNNIVGW